MTRPHIPRARSYRKPIGARARFDILERDGFRCRYCGATAKDDRLHVDHVEPVSLGGGNDPENLATACSACNFGKSDRIIETEDERFSQTLYTLIWPFLKWSEQERDGAILVITRMASVGYALSDLMEMGRASKDLRDVVLLSEWLSEAEE